MSEYVAYHDGSKTDEIGFGRHFFRAFSGGYLVGATAPLQVVQRGAGANMSVDVSIGDLLLKDTDRTYVGWVDAAKNVSVTAADATNPRKDIVVAYVDKAVVDPTNANTPGGLKFKAVAGTPAGSPADPSGATIQASVGAGNPYYLLARLTIPAAVSSIVTAYITDLRVPAGLAQPYLVGGSSNTNGHLVPNVADDTVALLAAVQTFSGIKTFSASPVFGATDFQTVLAAGWLKASGTWTYISATSVTVPALDAANLMVGMKVWLVQGTNKYFYVTGVSGTTVTFAASTDYSVATPTAITAAYYSSAASPVGHPDWLNYLPTYSASGTMTWTSVTTTTARYRMLGRQVDVQLLASGTTGGTASNELRHTFPVPAATAGALGLGTGYVTDGGAGQSAIVYRSSTTVASAQLYNAATFGLGASRMSSVSYKYEV